MFSAENLPGMIIGLVIIIAGTFLAVRGHVIRARRAEADEQEVPR